MLMRSRVLCRWPASLDVGRPLLVRLARYGGHQAAMLCSIDGGVMVLGRELRVSIRAVQDAAAASLMGLAKVVALDEDGVKAGDDLAGVPGRSSNLGSRANTDGVYPCGRRLAMAANLALGHAKQRHGIHQQRHVEPDHESTRRWRWRPAPLRRTRAGRSGSTTTTERFILRARSRSINSWTCGLALR